MLTCERGPMPFSEGGRPSASPEVHVLFELAVNVRALSKSSHELLTVMTNQSGVAVLLNCHLNDYVLDPGKVSRFESQAQPFGVNEHQIFHQIPYMITPHQFTTKWDAWSNGQAHCLHPFETWVRDPPRPFC
ncbi:hypothetical protein VNO77_25997 [Canavalia gladiata]|uniref:Uncharacterized protein n=1 Tax=Canavalia gladiata TaxID=3824 RepID=A0AAN9Q5Y4_CANGL